MRGEHRLHAQRREEEGRAIITNFVTIGMLLAGSDAELHSLHSHFFIHVRVLQMKESSHLYALSPYTY